MDGRNLGHRAMPDEHINNALHGSRRKRRHIFAEIDRKVCFAIRLIGRKGRSGNLAEHLRFDLSKLCAIRPAFITSFRVTPLHSPGSLVVAKRESAVFPHHAVNRPLPGNEVAPSSRAACHRHDDETGRMKLLKRSIASSRQPALMREGIVNVSQHSAHMTGGLCGKALMGFMNLARGNKEQRNGVNKLCCLTRRSNKGEPCLVKTGGEANSRPATVRFMRPKSLVHDRKLPSHECWIGSRCSRMI